jgi:hypothetical protein
LNSTIQKELDIGVHLPETYIHFAKRIESSKLQLLAILKRLKADGKTIVAYGASATSTTLYSNFELGEYFEYFIDENEAKKGLLCPGLHKMVYGPEKIAEDDPDYILVLAWRFVEPIVKKTLEQQNFKGRFIVPLPDVKIL